jgi:hypothetical protein
MQKHKLYRQKQIQRFACRFEACKTKQSSNIALHDKQIVSTFEGNRALMHPTPLKKHFKATAFCSQKLEKNLVEKQQSFKVRAYRVDQMLP